MRRVRRLNDLFVDLWMSQLFIKDSHAFLLSLGCCYRKLFLVRQFLPISPLGKDFVYSHN
jgi:hypothetical protein